jgi:NAD(P)-dependent dehydrogenase (short-subunit alcohol dehydrogenase family)
MSDESTSTAGVTPGRLDAKVALVTGGGSGIGEAVVRRMVAEGASVVVMDVQMEAAERVAGDVPHATPFAGDVTDPEVSERAVAHAVEAFGGLHISANVAGIGGPLISTEDYPVDDWRKVIDVNLSGVYYSMRAQLRHMLANGGGSIVNMASMFSVVARDSMVGYVAAKHGVLGLTRAAAIDCAERGVRVNCVGPAVIRTPLLAASLDQAGADHLASLNPFNRLGEPDEVASIVVWLASDEASFVSGGFYAVDGAFTAR